MALFEVTAYDKKIYEEELKDFLPDKILDVHTHVWLDSNLPKNRVRDGRTVLLIAVTVRERRRFDASVVLRTVSYPFSCCRE